MLEGELLPVSKTTLPEGPFGEFTGYYAADARPCPVMQVNAIHHRDDPILLGSPPMKPPRFHFGLPFRAASIWSNLETGGVSDVVGVWQHVAQLMTVVALKQRYAGHAKRAGADRGGATATWGASSWWWTTTSIPSNLADVMWAVTTRCEPAEQIDIVRNAWSSALDPRIPGRAKARRHHLALQGDHRGGAAVRLERQISADLGADRRRGARDREQMGRCHQGRRQGPAAKDQQAQAETQGALDFSPARRRAAGAEWHAGGG